MYRALPIKNWIISEVSPFGWSTVIMRALPELLETNSRFSAYYVGKGTKWSQIEVDIIQYYLKKIFNKSIPIDYLCDNVELPMDFGNLPALNFFTSDGFMSTVQRSFHKIFKLK